MTTPIEMLRETDKAYASAAAAHDVAHQAVKNARSQEGQAAEKRADQYNKVLGNGFIIERITEPDRISYFAGMTEGNILNPEDDGSRVCLELDEDHAASLEGLLAIGASIRTLDARTEEEMRLKAPLPGLIVDFEVTGIHTNQQGKAGVHRGDWMGDNTQYSGELEAITWRLPSEEEILQFGGALAVDAT